MSRLTASQQFLVVSNIDIDQYFSDFSDFTNNQYQKIVDYYSDNADLEGQVILDLLDLAKRAVQINNTFINYKDRLTNRFDDWELLENFEKTKSSIATIINSQKWFRSTKSLFYDNKFSKDYVLKQFQTLSNLAFELGYSDPNNDWSDIALRNNLKEEDYEIQGGSILKVSFSNNLDYKLNSVLDSFDGEKVYGKDFQKEKG